jgi:GH25 family lysozyme M1 (1,4-beta-N-acetylmuramidase)
MSEPTLSLAVGVGDVAAGGVCEKHTILFPLSHTGGLFHPYKHVCPFCRAERAEARVKVLEKALEYAALCPVCADIEECKCQPDCEDCVKTMQKARAALRAERGGEDE